MRGWAKRRKYDSMGGRAGKIASYFIVSTILTFACSFAIQCASNGEVHAASSTLTLSITDNITLNMLPSTNGTFATSDTSVPNISVTTNHATGYTLGIKASSEGANALVNTTDSTKTIPSITSASFPTGITEANYGDDTYASSNNLNNTWGYRPSKINSTANSNYLPLPTSATNEVILDQTSTANSSTANTYNIAIGTRVDNTTAVGSYAATFIITAVVNPITYNITYNDNSSSAGTGFPANVVGQQTMDTAVQLSSTTPTRTTYDFAGWCTVNTADNGTCSGTTYQAGGNWTLDQTTNPNSLTLYAMWNIKTHNLAITFAGIGVNSVKICTVSGDCTGDDLKGTVSTSGGSVSGLVEGSTYYLYPTFSTDYELDNWANTGSYGTLSSTSATNPTFTIGAGDGTVRITGRSKIYMQNMSSSQCTTTPQTVYDSRDEQAYKVAKLADGKCWMVENLNLAGGTAIEATKTDVDASYISSFTTSNNLTKSGSTIVLPASSTSGFNTNNYSYVYNSGNKTNCGASGQNTPCYSYYSWDAATLGSGRSISTDNQNAPYSICPKGWKLPSTYNGTNSSTDFRALMIAYGGSNSIQSYSSSTSPTGATMYNSIGPGTTPNFLLAGFYLYGSFYDGGSSGGYWSSTSYGNTSYARYLFFYSSSVDSASGYYRSYGFSVRCLQSS